jgi:hypothetical protein
VGGYIVIFMYVLTIYFRFTSSIILLHPPSPLLKTLSTGFILFSCMNTKYIHHIHTHSPFPYIHLLALAPTPGNDLFYPPVLQFFKKLYIDSPRECHGTSDLYGLCFNQIDAPLSHLLFLYHHAPLMVNSLQYSALYYIHM